MSEKKGERKNFPARIPREDYELLEKRKEETGKSLNELLLEALDLFLRPRRGLLTPDTPDINIKPEPHLISKAPHLISPDIKTLGLDIKSELTQEEALACAQLGDKLEPSQEEALSYAQHLLEEKRSKTTTAPRPASQAIEASVKRGVLQRLLCSEDGCKQGAARSMNGKSYCDHHGSLQDYAALPAPSAPPVSTVELPPCDICQHRRFLVTEREGKLSAERCPHCLIDCQACEKGLIFWKDRQGYEKWLPCGCRKTPIQRQIAAIQYADFPGAFASLLFGKLPSSELSDSQKQAHLLSWEWAKKFTNKEKSGFFFYGSPGTGKTLALCRALALLLQRESCLRVRYLHFPAWLDLKKQSFGSEETMECASELVGHEVLLVDEILLQGKSGVVRSFTEWERSQFDLMVHNRWLAGKPTLYATNYKPEQVEAELSESTWSRIRSTAAFFEVSGKDLRLPQNVLPFTPRGPK